MELEETKRMVELLTEAYRRTRSDGATNLALATLEDELWSKKKVADGPGLTKKGERRDWFQETFGGNVSEYEVRATMFNAGEPAHVLLERMDNNTLSPSMARKILSRGRELSKQHGVDLDICVDSVLKQFPKVPVDKAKLPRAPTKKRETAARAVAATSTEFSTDTGPTQLSKQFKVIITETAENYVTAMFFGRNVSESQKNRLSDDFRISIDQLIDEWRKKIVTAKRQNREDTVKQLSRERFEWACEVLGFNLKFGDAINLKTINRRKIERARNLHPDRNSSPEARDEYEDVLDAYSIFQEYHDILPNGRKAEECL